MADEKQGEQLAKDLEDFIDDSGTSNDDNDGDVQEDEETNEEDNLDDEDDSSDDETDDSDSGDSDDSDDSTDDGEQEDSEDSDEDEDSEEEENNQSEVDELKGQIKILTDMVTSLSDKKVEKKEEKSVDKVDIFKGDSFKNVIETLDMDETEAGAFKAFLNEFRNEVMKESVEQSLLSTPEVVNKFMKHKTTITSVKDKFYKDNPKLENVSKYVSQIANNIAADEPTLNIQQVLNKAAE